MSAKWLDFLLSRRYALTVVGDPLPDFDPAPPKGGKISRQPTMAQGQNENLKADPSATAQSGTNTPDPGQPRAGLAEELRPSLPKMHTPYPHGGPFLILPNNPAMVDPLIVYAHFAPLAPRLLMTASHARALRFFAPGADIIILPSNAPETKDGTRDESAVTAALTQAANCLAEGHSLIVWPAGQLQNKAHEKLPLTNTIVELFDILPKHGVPLPELFLVRIEGLWGSQFSRYFTPEHNPGFFSTLCRQIPALLTGPLLPRRPVRMVVRRHKLHAPHTCTANAGKESITSILSTWYDAGAEGATLVPRLPLGRIQRMPISESTPVPADMPQSGANTQQAEKAPQDTEAESPMPQDASITASPEPQQSSDLATSTQAPSMHDTNSPKPTPDTKTLPTEHSELPDISTRHSLSPPEIHVPEDNTSDSAQSSASSQAATGGTWLSIIHKENTQSKTDSASAPTTIPPSVPEPATHTETDPADILPKPVLTMPRATASVPPLPIFPPSTSLADNNTPLADIVPVVPRTPPLLPIQHALTRQGTVTDVSAGLHFSRRTLLGLAKAMGTLLGPVPASRIGLALPAGAGAMAAYIAILDCILEDDRVPVLLNPDFTPEQLAHCAHETGITHVITSRQLQGHGLPPDTIPLYLEDITQAQIMRGCALSFLGFAGNTDVDAPAAIVFTAGTTGQPKALILSHTNLMTSLCGLISPLMSAPLNAHALSLLCCMPPHTPLGLLTNIILPLTCGVPAVTLADPTDSDLLARTAANYGVNCMVGTPDILTGMLREARTHLPFRFALCGQQACPEALRERFAKVCPHGQLLECYSLAEGSVLTLNTHQQPGSVGKMLPGTSYALHQGQLYIRGDTVCAGYFNGDDPRTSLPNFSEKDWFPTGDMFEANTQGYLFWKGKLPVKEY